MQIKQRQQNLGDNNTVLDFRTKLPILGTYLEQAKKDFNELDDEYPESEESGGDRDMEYARVDTSYQ